MGELTRLVAVSLAARAATPGSLVAPRHHMTTDGKLERMTKTYKHLGTPLTQKRSFDRVSHSGKSWRVQMSGR